MTIDFLFPVLVYNTSLDLKGRRRDHRAMLDYVDQFKFNNLYDYSTTGDTVNDFQVSNNPAFSWLNKEVYKHTLEYLKEFGIDTDSLDVFSSKSWPVVCNPERKTDKDDLVIQKHNHPNSHLSAVFYLQTDSQSGGMLKLHASHSHPIRYVPLQPFIKEPRYAAMDSMYYKPTEGMLVIFPSSVEHEVSEYHGEFSRYSITYDLIVTSKSNLDTDNEMCIVNPINWTLLNDQEKEEEILSK